MYLPQVEIHEPASLLRRRPDDHASDRIVNENGTDEDQLAARLKQAREGSAPLILTTLRKQRRAVERALSRSGWVARRRGLLRSADGIDSEALLLEPSPYHVDALDDDDIDDVLALFTDNFHAARSRAHWDWKFDGNPYSRRNIAICRHERGELAAHYSAYETRWVDATRGRVLQALQIGDVMSAEAHRHVGRAHTSLLARTVLFFDAKFSEDRVGFDFGFNTGSAWKFFIRFHRGQEVERVMEWERSAERPLPPSVGRCRIRPVERTDAGFDRLFKRAAPTYGALVERSARWLRWRYLDCPDEPAYRLYTARRWGRLVGWIVVRPMDGTLRWCDALTTPRHRDCMGLLLEQARRDHPECSRLLGWFPDRPEWWTRELNRLGFEGGAQSDGLALICAGRTEPDPAALLGRSYYTWGDSDLG